MKDTIEKTSPLAGRKVALTDNISATKFKTTCGSKMLIDYQPVFNAAVVEKLENAGLIITGKLNIDEFGLSETKEFSAFCSALDAQQSAAGEIPLIAAVDSGGNIRQSALRGATGIKPTYGSVSRYGIIACASSLDQAGPVGRDIEDCAALLSVISGPDDRDSTCIIKKSFEFDKPAQDNSLKNIKIGLPRNILDGSLTDMNPEIKTAFLSAVKEFETAGASVEKFEMPLVEYIIPVFNIIEAAEISSNLAKFDGLKFGYRSPNAKTLSDVYKLSRSEGFGMEVKTKIMLGSLVLSSGCYDLYYRKALQTRTLIIEAYKKLFEQYDMILSPISAGDPITLSVNLAGLPAAALPCGKGIGFQLIGEAFAESKLINAARFYQKKTGEHNNV